MRFLLTLLVSEASQAMAEKDPHGWILTIVSITVVFTALALLWLIFGLFFTPKRRHITKYFHRKNEEKVEPVVVEAVPDASGEVYAAIATALDAYLSDSVHDRESYVITIRRNDSPWRSKALTLRKN